MKRTVPALRLFGLVIITLLWCLPAMAHDVPFSNLALRLGNSGVSAELRLPWMGVTAELSDIGPVAATAPDGAEERLQEKQGKLISQMTQRLRLTADGEPLTDPEVGDVRLSDDRSEVRLDLTYPYRDGRGNLVPPPQTLVIIARLLHTDARHKTLLRIYRGTGNEALEREEILNFESSAVTHTVGGGPGVVPIIGQFIREGVHHIFIGPDHILFLIGLLLAGGNRKRVLKIVTAFTLAHSLTLAVAALGWWTPPSRLVECVIALSIVFVGLDVLLRIPGPNREEEVGANSQNAMTLPGKDRRVLYAFVFGLIHGFGFASVMSGLDLPRYALGWTLLAFNIGVEVGQACIILLTLPLLVLLTRRNPRAGRTVVLAGALCVTAAGAYWFIERAFG